MNGAQSLFKALVDAGITTCFANPGTSEMQLVYEIGMTDKVRPVLCLQEDVVTGAADGYARMKGAPAFTLLHVGSGFANGVAMLHNAGRANTPIVNVVGANASYHQPNCPEHELINGRVADLARTVSYWSQEARSASNLGELGAEAAALAKTGKICTVIAPTNWHWEEANPPPIVPASPGRPKTATEAIAHAATMLKNGKKTGLVLGNLALRGEALTSAGRIAATIRRGSPRRNLSVGSSFARRRTSLGGHDPLRIRNLRQVSGKLPAAGFCRRTVSGRHIRLPEQADLEEPAGLRSVRDGFGRAGFAGGAEIACRSDRSGQRGVGASASDRGCTAKRRPDGGSHRANALHADAGKRHSRRRSGDQWSVDLRCDEGRSRARLSQSPQWGRDRRRPSHGLGRGDRVPDRKVVHLQADGSGMYTVQALWSMARERPTLSSSFSRMMLTPFSASRWRGSAKTSSTSG